ncbi:MAG: hypothetical protein HY686_07155 [Chloroflexi bacterium]|nr:hypothetical protein [Chloroflexota bacterium]
MMRPRDWLLLYMHLESPHQDRLDPIRIMKGLFLFAQEGGLPSEETYQFVPYAYGPCSFDIYDDLRALQEEGLIEGQRPLGATWLRYHVTIRGNEKAATLLATAPPEKIKTLDSIKEQVMSKSFLGLLRFVYAKYPAFATSSVLNP